jgi:hypothetical protein
MAKSKKGETALVTGNSAEIDEISLYEHVVEIIEKRKFRAASYANSEITLMFWEVGHHTNSILLGGERAEYGKRIVATLSQQLQEKYGNSFEPTNLRRMMRFAERINDFKIVATLSPQLSWSHIIDLLPIKTMEARLFYAKNVVDGHLGVRAQDRLLHMKKLKSSAFSQRAKGTEKIGQT